ncbi:hypothetical protein D9619_009000 [Psilocybe cf. subviscida]|uniref:non-specific serine/threonine protein kinase n=1 Tax=Psilocybe cf. subviscida TaxID=2480587 RepID=A0A8H5BW12_9AGAR|nr:hypothetical protein D9619_009000 [Psilocybe cf. subviscida]
MPPNPQTNGGLQIPSGAPNSTPSRAHSSSGAPPHSAAPTSSSSRAMSVAPLPTSSSQMQPPSSVSRRQRASHNVTSSTANGQQQGPSQAAQEDAAAGPIDVYAHPAVQAYATAHPRRTIPKFGPYLLLQTLGEGEFGKVKLGIHTQYGEEVAVKLIRRGNVDTTLRLSKVEREIQVLKTLKHPSIVRLYDVIETDKYIGIILEYASGGELFDHILAQRYLKERDAAKLFSQLISGVWYIHQKKIVHRDLKLENLLLDRHRNVIITDFGFANRFEHKSDDLMQTSCGSPCYAAPELVISEGLYVGSAVDIWSCGVILYAMLAGYLPFDDDPANPDGDNINLLYKYIVSTPLSFPDYISMEARELLGMMLVPDPTRRTTLDAIMRHPWLGAYYRPRTDGQPNAFGKTVDELEKAALDQHQQKRLAYQRQIRQAAIAIAAPSPSRTQSYHPGAGDAPPSASRSRSTQPEYLYDSSVDQSMMSPGTVVATPTATPQQANKAAKTFSSPHALGLSEDDPFAGPGGSAVNTAGSSSRTSDEGNRNANNLAPGPPPSSSKGHKSNSSGGGGFRHTIQVEYDDPSKGSKRGRERTGSQTQANLAPTASEFQQEPQPPSQQAQKASSSAAPVPITPAKERRPSQSSGKPLPPSPALAIPAPSSYRAPGSSTPKSPSIPASTPPSASAAAKKVNRPAELEGLKSPIEPPALSVSSPPPTPSERDEGKESTGSHNSTTSFKYGHKKTKSSIDRIGLSKIFGSNFTGSSSGGTPTTAVTAAVGDGQNSGVGSITPVMADGRGGSTTSVLLSPVPNEKEKDSGKKSRRNTLTVVVEPFRSIRNRKGKAANTPLSTEGASAAPAPQPQSSKASLSPSPNSRTAALQPSSGLPPPSATDPTFSPMELDSNGMPASTNKARKVMQWFRTKSKGRDSLNFAGDESMHREKDTTPTPGKYRSGYSSSTTTVNQATQQQQPASATGLLEAGSQPVRVVVTQPPNSARPALAPSGHPSRSASTATEGSGTVSSGFVARFRQSVNVGGGSNSQSSSAERAQPHSQLRLHHGTVDSTTVTTKPPPQVMAHVKQVLEDMGIEFYLESQYKYRCTRTKKKKGAMSGAAQGQAPVANSGLAAMTMVGSAASNGVDKRGLPLPSPSGFGGGGMLRGLLMRRQSSQVSNNGPPSAHPSLAFDDETSVVVNEPLSMETIYGDPNQDAGDEVRFYVELTRLDRLNDTYSLDIRRLKGNLRSYKFLYDTLRDRASASLGFNLAPQA